MPPTLNGGADLDESRRYRYRLWREVDPDEGRSAIFIMLNPSTADALVDDPTIRRCVGFTRAWGCGMLIVVNLYAFRATNPKDLRSEADRGGDIIGPSNDVILRDAVACGNRDLVVCAWGCIESWMKPRADMIRRLASGRGVQLHVLGFTKAGHPRHPLYLPRHREPLAWSLP